RNKTNSRRNAKMPRTDAEVLDEVHIFGGLRPAIRNPQQIGRMDRHQEVTAIVTREDLATHLRNDNRAIEQTPRRRRTERNDDVRLDDEPLQTEPPAATLDLVGVWPLVKPALPSWLEFEMLDRVGDKDGGTVKAGISNGPIEHATRRADERVAFQVLIIA